MNIDRMVLAFAGSMILLSVALVHFHSPWWLLLTCFVGLNLIQSAFTGFCPLELILRKLGEGANERDLLDAYPNLKAEDIRTAMIYAAEVLAHEEIV